VNKALKIALACLLCLSVIALLVAAVRWIAA
jgi:hypothetical protein